MKEEQIDNFALLLEEAKVTTSPKRLKELALLDFKLAEIIAQNESTAPELLERLGYFENKDIKKAVAGNPNTPIKILFELAKDFPDEFLKNSVLSILFLENINYLEDLQKESLKILVEQKSVPKHILKYAISLTDIEDYFPIYIKEKIAEIARMHVNLYGEMAEGWHKAAKIEIDKFYYSYCNCFDRLNYNHDDDFYEDRCERLRFLSYFEYFIPESLFQHNKVTEEFANNHKTSKELLSKLSNSEHIETRKKVSTNSNTPINILEKLSNDENTEVRAYMARESNAPMPILEKLAKDKDKVVRRCVALNQNTPAFMLEKLAIDEKNIVRAAVAKNKSTSIATLEKMITDRQTRVVIHKNAKRNRSKRLLARHGIKNNKTNYKQKTKDENIIKVSYEKNSRFIKLLEEADMLAMERILNNPECNKDIEQVIFSKIHNLNEPFFTLILFLSDHADSSVLTNHVNSDFWLHRYAIAQNNRTPDRALRGLTEDINRVVRATAKENLQKR